MRNGITCSELTLALLQPADIREMGTGGEGGVQKHKDLLVRKVIELASRNYILSSTNVTTRV
jgi:hypothetical protein